MAACGLPADQQDILGSASSVKLRRHRNVRSHQTQNAAESSEHVQQGGTRWPDTPHKSYRKARCFPRRRGRGATTQTHAQTQTRTHIHTATHTYTQPHTNRHTHTHTHTQPHTNSHTHIHTPARRRVVGTLERLERSGHGHHVPAHTSKISHIQAQQTHQRKPFMPKPGVRHETNKNGIHSATARVVEKREEPPDHQVRRALRRAALGFVRARRQNHSCRRARKPGRRP